MNIKAKVIIFILIILLVLSGGYIIYLKCNLNENNINNMNDNSNEKNETNIKNHDDAVKFLGKFNYDEKIDIADFNKEIDFKKNFKNVKIAKKDYEFVANCDYYMTEVNECVQWTFDISKPISYSTSRCENCTGARDDIIYKRNNYYIIKGGENDLLILYDEGYKVYEFNGRWSQFGDFNIIDNKLYYTEVTAIKEDDDCESKKEALKYIDLNDSLYSVHVVSEYDYDEAYLCV